MCLYKVYLCTYMSIYVYICNLNNLSDRLFTFIVYELYKKLVIPYVVTQN